MNIINISEISEEFVYKEVGLTSLYLGKSANSKKFSVTIDRIAKGAESTKYHYHTKQEEFFIVLNGKGIIRTDNGEHKIKKGDYISKIPFNDTHKFINNDDEILEILDISSNEEGDIVIYPDDDIIYIKDIGKAFNMKDEIISFNSDPN